MASDTPDDVGALDAAIAQARAELDALGQAASAAAAEATSPHDDGDYSLHEVDGIGRYAIPRRTGWQALLKIIHDPAANIDFSTNLYPGFDGVLGERFNSPHLLDPLDDKYDAPWEPYKRLRDNIAAVRNFLMESYYANTPPGMTPEKAKAALAEIATYVGDGLYNNWRFGIDGFHIIPYHDIRKPFISLSDASMGGGAGAQYIYNKILEMHRQSNWMRPFSAVLSFFGGEPPPDWMLPPAGDTHFTDLFTSELRDPHSASGPSPDEMAAAIARVEALKAQRAQLQAQHDLNAMAVDLDAVGNHLIYSAENMQNVTALAEPVRSDAIEIARDILRKLKVSLGSLNVIEGLNLKPTDNIATLGAIKGVSTVYEKLLAWGRGVDPSIMQHPSIIAATQSLGQLGFLAKVEALKMAKAAGNNAMVANINEQLKRVPAAYAAATEKTFGGLIDKIDSGITAILTRVQTISVPGAKVGFSAGKELGSYMSNAPTAGLANTVTTDGVEGAQSAAKRNAAVLQAEEMAAQAQLARSQSQLAAASRQQGGNTQAQPSRAGNPRQAAQQVRTAQQRSTIQPAANAAANAALRQQATQSSANHAAHQHEEDAHRQQQQRQQQQLREAQIVAQQQQAAKQQAVAKAAAVAKQQVVAKAAAANAAAAKTAAQQAAAKAAAAKATMQKIDPKMLQGFQAATSTKGMGAVVAPAKPVAPAQVGMSTKLEDQMIPPPPPGKGGGRGF